MPEIDLPPRLPHQILVRLAALSAGENADPAEIQIQLFEISMDLIREPLPCIADRLFQKNQDPAAAALRQHLSQGGIAGRERLPGENHPVLETHRNIKIKSFHLPAPTYPPLPWLANLSFYPGPHSHFNSGRRRVKSPHVR